MLKVNRSPLAHDATGFSVHVGDVVSISTLPLFGRAGTVEKIGRKYLTVSVHLTNRTARIRPESLRVIYLSDGSIR